MHGIIVAAIAAVALALGPDPSAAELRVFVTNEKSDDVTVIAAATGDVLQTIAVGKRPRGVAGSPDGKRVYVSNSNSDTLSIIDAASLAVIATLPASRDPRASRSTGTARCSTWRRRTSPR